MTTYVGVDVGGGGIRIRVSVGGEELSAEEPGPVPRRSGHVDTQAVAARIGRLAAGMCASVDRVAVGLTGMPGLLEDPKELAEQVHRFVRTTSVVVASDALTTHLGALAGRPGCVVAAGTGVIALGTDHETTWRQADGWGHLLGDEGSGAWIGREALQAALRHRDGRDGGSELLLDKLLTRFGDTDALLRTVYGSPSPAHELAAFAPLAADAAHENDPVAAGIWSRAGTHLAASAHAAARALPPEFSWGGRLFDAGPLLLDPFRAELTRRRPSALVREPAGQAVDGALLLARRGLPPEHPHPPEYAVELRRP
ncbi:N-acetylglucosamine kinase [Actinophytocola sp.]|uniref:N-acetylglucosamine kinase n=1 Tax=Actinophytocola sp. TaxID=1872138 RepID=UPI002ED3CB96